MLLLLLLTLLLSPQGSIHARAETGVTTVPLAPWSGVGGVGGVGTRPRPIAASSRQRSKQLMAGGVGLNGGSGRGTHIGSSPRSAWNVTVVAASAWTVWQFVLQLIGGGGRGRLAVAAVAAASASGGNTGLRVGAREDQAEKGK